MSRRLLLHNASRIALAASGVVAMSYMLATIRDRPDFNVGNYFSFFTIQSNILAAVRARARRPRPLQEAE